MSSSATKIKSMGIILDYLEVHKRATAEELRNRLNEHEMASSERTFERLKADMQMEFGIELVYENNAYTLRRLPNPAQAWFLEMIEIMREMEFYRQALEHPVYQQRILPEEPQKPNFYHHLAPIFQAIVKSHKVAFTYHFFDGDQRFAITIEPYLLKKYQQRWYVVGKSDYHGEVRNYGLDRIEDLQLLSETFKFSGADGLIKKFESTVGLNYSEAPIRLVIRAFDLQRYYLQEVPLHHSQKEIGSGANWTDFVYKVRPNFELTQRLLQIADQAVVLEPASFKQTMEQKIQDALALYKSQRQT